MRRTGCAFALAGMLCNAIQFAVVASCIPYIMVTPA